MKDIAQSPPPDTAAHLEGRILAVVALLLVGIGFWQHYTDYVEAEQRGHFAASVQTAPGRPVAPLPGRQSARGRGAARPDRLQTDRLRPHRIPGKCLILSVIEVLSVRPTAASKKVIRHIDALPNMREVAAVIAKNARENVAGADVISVGSLFAEPRPGGVQYSVVVIVPEPGGKDFSLSFVISTSRSTHLWPPCTGRG